MRINLRIIVTCLAVTSLWLGTAAPLLAAPAWMESVKKFLARPAGDWPLFLLGLNGVILCGLVVVALVKAICTAGSPSPTDETDYQNDTSPKMPGCQRHIDSASKVEPQAADKK